MLSLPDSLGEVVAAAADAAPDDVAVSDTTRTLTYGQLRARSTALARRLSAQGVACRQLVGLVVERSVDTVVGMLAILKCGAAYVPIDPAYPADRRAFVIRDSEVSFLVGSATALASGDWPDTVRCCVVEPSDVVDGADPDPDPVPVGPSDPAYVIYTSGSTGVPKGCVVTHGNVLALLRHTLPLFDVDSTDRWSVFHSFSFDFSVWELWGALATGATAVIVPPAATRIPAQLVETLVRERVTVLSHVPSVFRTFTGLQRYPADQLRYIVLGGESVDLAGIGKFWSHCNRETRPEVVNMYGITETTVHTTFRVITEADLVSNVRSPIGTPLPHMDIELRDTEPPHRLVLDGAVGEMWIRGSGVADGYLNRPDLTAARFVTDEASGTRFYRSGDLARRLPGGELEYLGRNDNQVKLRGFRIELAEIEAVLREQPGVVDAAACVVTRKFGSPTLVVCLVPSLARDADSVVESVRSALLDRLPGFMLPDRYVIRAALPLTLSGKLDRSALIAVLAETPAGARRTIG